MMCVFKCSNSAGSQQYATDEELPITRQTALVPSKPDLPVATNDLGIYVTMQWTEPEDDGGADITGYTIKYGGEDTDVDEYAELIVIRNITNFQFTDQLNEDTSYRFAVAAVNASGRGKFSGFTDYVLTLFGEHCFIFTLSPCNKTRPRLGGLRQGCI